MKISFKNSKAFTLAEITIVLVVIGILTAILMPIAFQSSPDENVLKFKKTNETLQNAIRELVNSDKHYLNGDLGRRADGTLIDGTHSGDITYFCQTLTEVLNTKKISCYSSGGYHTAVLLKPTWTSFTKENGNTITNTIMNGAKKQLDDNCKDTPSRGIGAEITLLDGTVLYQGAPNRPFGYSASERIFSSPDASPTHYDSGGFDTAYKQFCIDVDGINTGEDPFGYGIRADGKILTGKRADEWLEKSAQKKQ